MGRLILFSITILYSLLSFAQINLPPMTPYFFSEKADEYQATFDFVFRSEFKSLAEIRKFTVKQKSEYEESYIRYTHRYLFGPLTRRNLGGPQMGWHTIVDWEKAFEKGGRVYLPYHYTGNWILHKPDSQSGYLTMPVPFAGADLETPHWQKCTDPEPDHQSMGMFWYFWDPDRPGCDQKEGREFARIKVLLLSKTNNLAISYPEYNRLVRNENGRAKASLTFAFGYTGELEKYNPETDNDFGVNQYRIFVKFLRANLGSQAKETPIYEEEYPISTNPKQVMGHRFTFTKDGVEFNVSVVAAGNVDQMDIFAKSFAHDHDSFFGWFGHSRIGLGFDSDMMETNLSMSPDYYSITPNYQLIYWAGCNSYSYYTVPFFNMKIAPNDPHGIRGLDIISNGLPSYFALNATNAEIIFRYLYQFKSRGSYQSIVRELEKAAGAYNVHVLVNVLGDEDNPR